MPKENKHSRGRREETKLKRKRDKDEETIHEPKRPKQDPIAGDEDEDGDVQFFGTDNAVIPEPMDEDGPTERPFYGMLEDEEQEYFRRADELLELNDFPDPEERTLFLANVYREAEGKELKIACSQSCSRLMERLILLSTTEQKKKLFEKFIGNFAHLVQHRFASHCCETLFIQSAPVVTEELTADSKEGEDEEKDVSMESLFLSTLDELEGQMTFLLTDRFASHTLRVLLVILSGRVPEQSSTKTLLQSKKKEKIAINNLDYTLNELTLNKRSVPSSFQFAVEKIISDTIATMDTSFIRVLATHPTGNPSLQLLLELELTNPNSKKGSNSSGKTIISALLPDDISAEASEAAVFMNGILYDQIGSRLLETICTFAPGKLFKQIYRTIFKERIAALARNEISSYVVIRVLNRLSKEDLEEAVKNILPQIDALIQRSRTTVVKTLLERCHARGADSSKLTDAIAIAYDSNPRTLILKMACIDDIDYLSAQLLPTPPVIDTTSEPEGTVPVPKLAPKATPQQLHGSFLAQAMLVIPGNACTMIQDGLLSLPPKTLLTLALWTSTSHMLQVSLNPISNSFSSSPPQSSNLTFRRKILNNLLSAPDAISILAQSPVGTHILDSILLSAPTLLSLIERVAFTLSTLESELRESFTGRIVWRNWSMDLFKRKRGEWVKKVQGTPIQTGKGYGHDVVSESKESGKGKGKAVEEGRKKTGIELAREKFAQNKAKRGTGVNKIAV